MLASGGRPVALARPGGVGGSARAAGKAAPVALPTPRPLAPPRAIAPPSTEYDESPVKIQIGDGVAVGESSGGWRRGRLMGVRARGDDGSLVLDKKKRGRRSPKLARALFFRSGRRRHLPV
jgi:hypothetical protein